MGATFDTQSDMLLHRTLTQVKFLGDLRLGISINFFQHEYPPTLDGQMTHRIAKQRKLLIAYDRGEGLVALCIPVANASKGFLIPGISKTIF